MNSNPPSTEAKGVLTAEDGVGIGDLSSMCNWGISWRGSWGGGGGAVMNDTS